MSRTKIPTNYTPYKGAKPALKPKGKPRSYAAQKPPSKGGKSPRVPLSVRKPAHRHRPGMYFRIKAFLD